MTTSPAPSQLPAAQQSRRNFLETTAAVGATAAVHGYWTGTTVGQDKPSPNERLNIAAIGTANRAGANIKGLADQNIVALADIDANLLDKSAVVYKSARKYRDFRDMLDKEGSKIDAVIVATPDHTHAPAAAMALRMGKHVYCEKPLTHTVKEARTLAELAKKNKLVTQMGTQIHSLSNYRRVVELIRAGAIGTVKEVHVWAAARYTDGTFRPAAKPPHVDWDLWLGPAPKRPYCADIHPFNWRKYWDYGTGALGDFGCHYMDLAHWALDLKNPVKVSAEGPAYNPVTPPAWMIVNYDYPARGKQPPVNLTWYDSGKRPAKLASLKDENGKPLNWGSGQLFVGSQGMILSNYTKHKLLPADQFATYQRPPASIPESIGHHAEFVHAIKNGGTTTCNFDYSGALTESVLLGTVAYRSGVSIEWDSENLKVTNSEKAQQFVHKEYRKGWEL